MSPIYYTLLHYDEWTMYLAATSKGLCFVGSSPASFEEMAEWAAKHMPQADLLLDDEKMAPYLTAFIDYLSGKSRELNLPSDIKGTPFQLEVWQALRMISYGETVTYGELASRLGRSPMAARSVGTAIGKNPLLIIFPCHRVIPKSGAPRGFRGGLDMKRRLLELEQTSL